MKLIPNQSKYYTDGIDLFSFKKRKYKDDYFFKHSGWRLTYRYEWRFYIKKEFREIDGKLFFYKTELPNYL